MPSLKIKRIKRPPSASMPKAARALLVVLVFGGIGAYIFGISHASGTATLTLSSSSSPVALGSTVTVTITENSGATSVNAVEADLTYDQTKLQFVSVNTSNSPFSLVANSAGGNGSVTLASASTVSLTGQQTVATVTFTAIGIGPAPITFANTSQVSEPNGTDDTGTLTGGAYTVADQSAPSVPVGLAATAQTASSITLSWTASTDNVGVTGYKIYRGGTQVGTSTTTSYTDTSLTSNTSYSYAIVAYDAAGNPSAQSSALAASTVSVSGDVNGDGHVNVTDLSILAATWHSTTDLRADLNHDGVVNVTDLSILAANWGK